MAAHYTSLKSFRQIIENGTLRLTHTSHLSDFTEGTSAARLLAERFRYQARWRSHFAAATAFVHSGKLKEVEELSAHGFVVCFSADPDDMSQWRSYADDGRGVSMQVNAERVKLALGEQAIMGPCAYVDVDEDSAARGIVGDEAFDPLDQVMKDRGWEWALGTDPNHPSFSPQLSDAIEVIQEFLNKKGAFIKDGSFKAENETRVFVPVGATVGDSRTFPVQYRATGRGLVPYIVADLSKGDPWLSQVTLGPAISDRDNEDAVSAFLRDKGHSRVMIKHSRAPYRPR